MRLLKSFEDKLVLHSQKVVSNMGSSTDSENTVQVHPMVVRKHSKFPSRERHLAIRRKKPHQMKPALPPHCGGCNEKTCQSCKCPRESHAIYQEEVTSVRERLGLKPESQSSKVDPRQLGYTWVPPGIMSSSKILRYFNTLPQDKVPKIDSNGERHREKQLSYQLPKQDLALSYCKHVEPQHHASYEDFITARNEIALDIGFIKDAPNSSSCAACNGKIQQGDLAVIAPKFMDQTMWHPKCFNCTECDELLVDLTYCVHDEKIYCERHYAEMLKPRCNACDEIDENARDPSADTTGKNVSSEELPALASALNDNAPNQQALATPSFQGDDSRTQIQITCDDIGVDVNQVINQIGDDTNILRPKFEERSPFNDILEVPQRPRHTSYNNDDEANEYTETADEFINQEYEEEDNVVDENDPEYAIRKFLESRELDIKEMTPSNEVNSFPIIEEQDIDNFVDDFPSTTDIEKFKYIQSRKYLEGNKLNGNENGPVSGPKNASDELIAAERSASKNEHKFIESEDNSLTGFIFNENEFDEDADFRPQIMATYEEQYDALISEIQDFDSECFLDENDIEYGEDDGAYGINKLEIENNRKSPTPFFERQESEVFSVDLELERQRRSRSPSPFAEEEREREFYTKEQLELIASDRNRRSKTPSPFKDYYESPQPPAVDHTKSQYPFILETTAEEQPNYDNYLYLGEIKDEQFHLRSTLPRGQWIDARNSRSRSRSPYMEPVDLLKIDRVTRSQSVSPFREIKSANIDEDKSFSYTPFRARSSSPFDYPPEQSLRRGEAVGSQLDLAQADSWTSLNKAQQFSSEVAIKIEADDASVLDWTDEEEGASSQHKINTQFDSDDHHHFRRFSETSEQLEFIRGREDFPDKNNGRRSRLLQYAGDGERGYEINREMDSDEYHHERRLSEILEYATRGMDREGIKFLMDSFPRSARERSPYKVLRADIDKESFLKRYYWKTEDDPHGVRMLEVVERAESRSSNSESRASSIKRDAAEEKMIAKERLAWVSSGHSHENLHYPEYFGGLDEASSSRKSESRERDDERQRVNESIQRRSADREAQSLASASNRYEIDRTELKQVVESMIIENNLEIDEDMIEVVVVNVQDKHGSEVASEVSVDIGRASPTATEIGEHLQSENEAEVVDNSFSEMEAEKYEAPIEVANIEKRTSPSLRKIERIDNLEEYEYTKELEEKKQNEMDDKTSKGVENEIVNREGNMYDMSLNETHNQSFESLTHKSKKHKKKNRRKSKVDDDVAIDVDVAAVQSTSRRKSRKGSSDFTKLLADDSIEKETYTGIASNITSTAVSKSSLKPKKENVEDLIRATSAGPWF